MLICEKAYMKEKKIYCAATKGPCGHVKMCQITMKWRQTERAEKCPLRKEES